MAGPSDTLGSPWPPFTIRLWLQATYNILDCAFFVVSHYLGFLLNPPSSPFDLFSSRYTVYCYLTGNGWMCVVQVVKTWCINPFGRGYPNGIQDRINSHRYPIPYLSI
jgi:hypothetical protein